MIRTLMRCHSHHRIVPPLLPLLIALAIFNAILPATIEHIRVSGFVDALLQGFGQSFVIWLSLAIAVWLYNRSDIDRTTPSNIVLLMCLLLSLMLAIPLATLSWCIAAVLVLLWRSVFRHDHYSRAVTILICAVALREPVSRVCLTLFSSEILSFDASIAALMLQMFNQEFVVNNNLIVQPNGYSLLILTGCSAFGNLSLSLLLWLALTQMVHQHVRYTDLTRIILVAVLVIALNALRLALMALDPQWYELLHQGTGASVYEGLGLISTLLCVRWRTRHEDTSAYIQPITHNSVSRSDAGTRNSPL